MSELLKVVLVGICPECKEGLINYISVSSCQILACNYVILEDNTFLCKECVKNSIKL